MKLIKEVYPHHVAKRILPINDNHSIHWLYSKELEKEIPATRLYSFRNALLTKGTIIELQHWKIYNDLTHIDWQNRFVKEKTLLGFFSNLIKGEHIRIKKGIWLTDEWSYEFFHWMADCLPRIAAVHPMLKDYIVLLPHRLSSYAYVRDSLQLLEIPHQFIENDKIIGVAELLLPTHTSPTGNPSVYAIEELKALFKIHHLNSTKEPYRKLYVSRKKAPKRRVQNEEEIIPVLLQSGFEIHVMEDYPLSKQIQLLAEAKIVAGLHGAGLVNTMFMQEGCTVLEIRNNLDDFNNCFFAMASVLKLKYYLLEANASSADGHISDCFVDPFKLKELINVL